MARIRTIKPEYWTSVQVVECSMPARLLFIGLWNFADDAGRIRDVPRQIKMKIFPGDDLPADDVHGLLTELSRNSLIHRYTVDNKGYIQITGWHHQKINRPNPTNIPANPGAISEQTPPEGKVREGKGREEKESLTAFPKERPNPTSVPANPGKPRSGILAKRATRIANGWTLPEAWRVWARQEHPAVDLARQADQFRDHWLAKAGKDGAKLDWFATWRNWVRRAEEYRAKSPGRAEDISLADRNDANWRKRAAAAAKCGMATGWPEEVYGPRPGQPGCEMPADIVAEYGLAPVGGDA